MMNCTVKVMAQYFENYSDTKTPYWKPKGGQEFQIVIDSDTILYSDELKSHLSNFLNPSDGNSDTGETETKSEPEMVTTEASSNVEDDFDKLFNS